METSILNACSLFGVKNEALKWRYYAPMLSNNGWWLGRVNFLIGYEIDLVMVMMVVRMMISCWRRELIELGSVKENNLKIFCCIFLFLLAISVDFCDASYKCYSFGFGFPFLLNLIMILILMMILIDICCNAIIVHMHWFFWNVSCNSS